MRYALIKDKKVINMIEWDGRTKLSLGDGVEVVKANDNAQMGGSYDNRTFTRIPNAPRAPATPTVEALKALDPANPGPDAVEKIIKFLQR
jgi:hypothetical protein